MLFYILFVVRCQLCERNFKKRKYNDKNREHQDKRNNYKGTTKW